MRRQARACSVSKCHLPHATWQAPPAYYSMPCTKDMCSMQLSARGSVLTLAGGAHMKSLALHGVSDLSRSC